MRHVATLALLALSLSGCLFPVGPLVPVDDGEVHVRVAESESVLPSNAKVFFFSAEPANLSFWPRVGPPRDPLEHETIGAGESFVGEVGHIVDPGQVEPGSTLTIDVTCDTNCSTSLSISFGTEPDLVPPLLPDEPFTMAARALPECPYGVVIEGYQLLLTGGPIVDESFVAVRIESPEVEALLVPQRSEAGTTVAFEVSGGDARELCVDVSVLDVSGNESAFAEPICAQLERPFAVGCGDVVVP